VREAYDATIALALAAQSAGSVDGTAIRDALVKIAGPGGTTYIPGAEGIAAALKAIKDGKDVNYEGAATTLDWDANGDVTTGYIGIWQYAGGTIEELSEVPFSLN
jgi:ABC-type branched-subunit amino acid transport system substrate-binding protein